MTHPIYIQTALNLLTITEVKAIAKQVEAIPCGDKRLKQNWIAAIISQQLINTSCTQENDLFSNPPSEINEMEEELVAPSRRLGASIIFIALSAILYTICLILIGIGLLIPPLIHWGWKVLSQSSSFIIQKAPNNIDYFPFPV